MTDRYSLPRGLAKNERRAYITTDELNRYVDKMLNPLPVWIVAVVEWAKLIRGTKCDSK